MSFQGNWQAARPRTRRRILIAAGITTALVAGLTFDYCGSHKDSGNYHPSTKSESGIIYGTENALAHVGQVDGKGGREVMIPLNRDGSLSDKVIDVDLRPHRDLDGQVRLYAHAHLENADGVVTVTDIHTGRSRVLSQEGTQAYRP